MAFCPNCRTEYRDTFTRCVDCGAELVASLPEEAPPESAVVSSQELVELASFPNSAEAEMIRELLEDNGIKTFLRGDIVPISAAPSTLLVQQSDLEDARSIYEGFFAGQPIEDESEQGNDEEK